MDLNINLEDLLFLLFTIKEAIGDLCRMYLKEFGRIFVVDLERWKGFDGERALMAEKRADYFDLP